MSDRDEGLAALKAGDLDTALRRLQAAVQAAPGDGPAWAAFGVALCQAGRAADGVKALERAIALQPTQARLHYNLGRALESLQRGEEALQAYRKAAALDPAHAQAGAAVARLEAVAPARPQAAVPASYPSPPPAAGEPRAPAVPAPGPYPPPAGNPAPASPAASAGPAAAAAAAAGSLSDFALGFQPAATPAAPAAPPAAPEWGAPASPAPGWGQPPAAQSEWGAPAAAPGGWQPAPPRPAAAAPTYTPPVSTPRAGGGDGFNWRPIMGVFMVLLGVAAGVARIYLRMGGLFGPSLDRYKAGATLSEPSLGLKVALPDGFPSRPPRNESWPMGAETATQATYDSLSGSRECVFAAMYFPPVIWQNASDSELFQMASQHMVSRLSATNPTSRSLQYQGYAASETRMGGKKNDETHFIRLRMVIAPPRMVLLAFGSKDEKDLDKPAVEGFMNSLAIEQRQAPSRTPAPGASPGFQMPSFQMPSMPEPPRIPDPVIPSTPPPPQPSFGPGGPGNPGGMPGGSGMPGGPGMSPGPGMPGGSGYPGGAPGMPGGSGFPGGGPGMPTGPGGNGV